MVYPELTNMGKFGGAHTALRNITRGMPSSLTSGSEGKRLIDEAVKELINIGLLLAKTSTKEIHVSLNPHKIKEIREFIVRHK